MTVPRWLELKQEIDHRLFLLGQISQMHGAPKSPMDAMIDRVCGRDFVGEAKKDAIQLLEELRELWIELNTLTGDEQSIEDVDRTLAELKA
jgi:hypothetical protein